MPLSRPSARPDPAAALAGCGFHLRGVGGGNLPYARRSTSPAGNRRGEYLAAALHQASGGTTIVDNAKQADPSSSR